MAEQVLLAGCGDLGQRVATLLHARGDTVFALRRNPPSAGNQAIHWLQADLTRPETLSIIPQNISQLIYLPAPDSRDPGAYQAIFGDGLRHLLQRLNTSTLQRVLFVSSSAVYGEHGDAWVDEQTPVAPLGFNGKLLLQAEQLLSELPVRGIVLRLAGLYGPGRMHLVERLRAGEARVPRAAPHWANRIHVDDAASAIAHLMALPDPENLYLGVDDHPLALSELYDAIAAMLGVPVAGEGPAPAGVGSKRLSNARLRATGFRCRWPDAREGYAELIRQAVS